jgi:phosphopantothenoylcysteine decarboxylase/phosphopantothenate--cysteine ligase
MKSIERIPVLEGRRLILGVTGSVAAYKAVDLASRLTQAGTEVDVILSGAAREFVTPLSFQSVTGRKTYTEGDLWGPEAHVLHIGLAETADLLLIAPATANTMAKLAAGQADTLLTLTALAARCPIMIAPAMDAGMYEHPATQANLAVLEARGAIIAGPAEGRMASGLIGKGRMLEPHELLGHVRLTLGKSGRLANRRVVVTAGGTQEPIDPVRVLTNRSSGKQGFALAQAALDRGAQVTLISAPVSLTPPVGVDMIDVITAEEMKNATIQATADADVLIMAAAVADFRPENRAEEKIKRSGDVPRIDLVRAADILAAVGAKKAKSGRPGLLVGFAAESEELLRNARKKLEDKDLDLIVANDISSPEAGFDVDTNRVTILDRSGGVEELPLLTKAEVGERVMDRIVEFAGER